MDKFCNLKGVDILRLPPYNCDLNPIEHIWGIVKNNLRDIINNSTKIAEIVEISKDVLRKISSNTAANVFQHVRKREEWYRKMEGMCGALRKIEPFIINLEDEFTDEDSDEDSDGEMI